MLTASQPAARSEDHISPGIQYGSRDVQKGAENDVDNPDGGTYWARVGGRRENVADELDKKWSRDVQTGAENDVDKPDGYWYWAKTGKQEESDV